jgi:hypothetical protein
MKFKTTVILFGIFIILLVFVYLFEGPLSERARKKEKGVIALFPEFEKGRATKIEVKSSTKEISLERNEEGWLISDTDGFIAEPQLVNTALDTIINLTRENRASKNPGKHELFEVTQGKGLEVKVSDANQKILAHLYIGKTGPDLFSTYLRKEGSDEVLLAAGYIKSTFDKSIKNWRDKTIFDFPPEIITQLILKTSKKEIVLEKDEEGDWLITKPEKVKAKKEETDPIGTTFASLKAIDFAEDYDLEKYKLDKPQIKITAILEDKEEKRLLIGKKHEEKSQYYVKNQAKETIFLVGKYQIDKMNKTLQDLKEEEKKEEEKKGGDKKIKEQEEEAAKESEKGKAEHKKEEAKDKK